MLAAHFSDHHPDFLNLFSGRILRSSESECHHTMVKEDQLDLPKAANPDIKPQDLQLYAYI